MTEPASARTGDTKPRYFPVSPLLILPRARGEFEVYLKQGDKLVLYATRGERFTEAHRKRLSDMGTGEVWIKAQERKGYERYVAEHLGEILGDESVPVAERAGAWHDVSTRMVQDMFGRDLPDEAFRSRFARIKGVIRAAAEFFTDPAALKELAFYMDKGFSSYQHGLTVMVYTVALLSTFENLGPDKVNEVAVGALLHDIGKSRLPEELMHKDPRLMDDTDRAALASHPALGVSVCARLPMSQESLNCILFHHERCDGSGYPSGATSAELPFYARVVSLVNRYDNLTRRTQFAQGESPFEALSNMKDQDQAWDSDLLKRFILVLSKAEIV